MKIILQFFYKIFLRFYCALYDFLVKKSDSRIINVIKNKEIPNFNLLIQILIGFNKIIQNTKYFENNLI